jgi:phage-related protein
MTINGQTIQDVLIAVALIGGIIVYSRGRIPQQTIKNLDESNKSYVALDLARQTSIKNLETKIDDIVKAHTNEVLTLNKSMAELQGQVKVYKELPLRELADGINKVAETNALILQTLKTSAAIASKSANDGGLLVKTKEGTPVTVKLENS